jgi:hypothetical protein
VDIFKWSHDKNTLPVSKWYVNIIAISLYVVTYLTDFDHTSETVHNASELTIHKPSYISVFDAMYLLQVRQ